MRDATVEVRVTANERETFREAATCAGLSLSAWARERLLQAATKESGRRVNAPTRRNATITDIQGMTE